MSARTLPSTAVGRLPPTQVAFLVGFVHAAVVLAAMAAAGYSYESLAAVSIENYRIFFLLSLVVLGGVPAFVAVRTRLLSPALVVALGSLSAIVATFVTPGPEIVGLGSDTLVTGPTYLVWLATGWPTWLLVAGLIGSIDYVLSVPAPDDVGPFETRPIPPLAWRRSLLAGLAAGLLHAFAGVSLSVQTDPGALSGLALAWGVLGLVVVGAIPAVALARYRLVAPAAVLALALLATGFDAFTVTLGSPAASYALFWPIYALLGCAVAGFEALGRRLARRSRRGDD